LPADLILILVLTLGLDQSQKKSRLILAKLDLTHLSECWCHIWCHSGTVQGGA